MGGFGTGLCREIEGGCELAVLVSAGSSRSGVQGIHGMALKVAVRSPPERGKANAEVERVLAGLLRLSRKQVRVVAGLMSRRKRVQLNGIGPAEVYSALQEAGWSEV